MKLSPIVIMYFRRDLRLDDNRALFEALKIGLPILCVFIFDDNILTSLPKQDARVNFIHNQINHLHAQLQKWDTSLYVKKGKPIEIFKTLLNDFDVKHIFANEDYEPYALQRDKAIKELAQKHNTDFTLCKDQVIFHKDEVTKDDGLPYTVFTPYKKKWLHHLSQTNQNPLNYKLNASHFYSIKQSVPSLEEIGFEPSNIQIPDFNLANVPHYDTYRNFPHKNHTSLLGIYLRFGCVSVRKILSENIKLNDTFITQLTWRDFFMQIIYHFPQVVTASFREKYNNMEWINDKGDFDKWKAGKTGYPMVDAGMRQLNQTGYMHNRVRMVVASFLCKHLLIDWRWGEAYFAEKLLDFELAANNGNWQWAAGTGCDAAPYFRVFNPTEQAKKFDPENKYINQWIPEINSLQYPTPIVEHKYARQRAIMTYKKCNTQS